MSAPERPPERLTERAAADWHARRRSGAMTVDEARALEAWLAEDPAHRAALDSVDLMWASVEAIRSDPAVLAIREAALKDRPKPRRMLWAGALAAGLVAALAAGSVLLQMRPDLTPGPRTFRTGAEQTTTITLPDGSKVTLDEATVLRANETRGRRRIELVEGRAFFRVAHDASRPFVVSARGKTITALGTAFDVSLEQSRVEVTLVEGRVKVEARVAAPAGPAARPVQSTELKPGAKLTAPDSGSWTVARVDTARETSWAAGQLVFAGRSLAQVAADLNRYSDRKVVLADPAVGRATISGSFDAGDVDAFVRAVEAYDLARVASRDDEQIVLSAPAKENPGG